jgi:TolA-binding protein
MADRESINRMRHQAHTRGTRSNYRAACLLGEDAATYDPYQSAINMMGDKEAVYALQIEEYVASTNSLLEKAAQKISDMQARIEFLEKGFAELLSQLQQISAKLDSLTPKGSKKS